MGLASPEALEQAYAGILGRVLARTPGAQVDGLLVCAQAPEGLEPIVGGVLDPIFGPTVMFGLGGVFAEVLKDVSFRLAPLSEADACELIREIQGCPAWTALRKRPR